MPSVATKGAMPRREMQMPLISPKARAIPRAIRIPTARGSSSNTTGHMPASVDTPATAPTDISTPPVIITSVIPLEIIPSMAAWIRMERKLVRVR